MLKRIISGGQTGVDRGALDAALEAGFACGGWCPEKRRAEDGPIPERYPLAELPGGGYRQRTRQNVIDSDGTLVISFGEPTAGTLETIRFAQRFGKPTLVIDGSQTGAFAAAKSALQFVEEHAIEILNVAGPRESRWREARDFAKRTIAMVIGPGR